MQARGSPLGARRARRRRLGAALLVGLSAGGVCSAGGGARAQGEPRRGPDDPADPLVEPGPAEGGAAPDDAALRRETARLAVALAAKRGTLPAERLVLDLTLAEAGRPLDRGRRLEVGLRRPADRPGREDVRVRALEPAAQRDEAWLWLGGPAGGEAWRFDPRRRASERTGLPDRGWRLGGTGLLLVDLRAERLGDHDYVLEARDQARGERRAHVVLATPRAGAPAAHAGRRRLWLDAEARVVVAVDHLDAGGAPARSVELGDFRWVAGALVPFRWRIAEPGPIEPDDAPLRAGRRTLAVARERGPDPPARWFEPGGL